MGATEDGPIRWTADPPRQVAWKPSARIGKLLVREYEARSDRELRLEWNVLTALPHEARISRLARWVIEADRIGARFALVLPLLTLGPAQGHAHRHACLQALARLGGGYAQAAASALLKKTDLSAREIVETALGIAGDICVFTNHNFTIEEQDLAE